MPIYEYHCQSCGRDAEIMQRMSDAPATECPSCHEQALVKQISAVGFRLKGGGWYETDFKSGDKRNLAHDKPEASTASSDKPAEKAAASSDKPAATESSAKTEKAAPAAPAPKPAASSTPAAT